MLGALSWGKSNGPKSFSPKVRIFFTFSFLAARTPTGGKLQNKAILAYFGLGRPWALREIPGPGPKMEQCNLPVLGALWGGKPGRPKSFSPKVRNFFTFSVLADQTTTGGRSRNTGVLGHFSLGQPLALTEIPGSGRKRKNTICLC